MLANATASEQYRAPRDMMDVVHSSIFLFIYFCFYYWYLDATPSEHKSGEDRRKVYMTN
jgi:hypothetical protein